MFINKSHCSLSITYALIIKIISLKFQKFAIPKIFYGYTVIIAVKIQIQNIRINSVSFHFAQRRTKNCKRLNSISDLKYYDYTGLSLTTVLRFLINFRISHYYALLHGKN